MSSFNKVTLLGNLANDPELRFTSGGTPVANFSVATNELGALNKETGERKQVANFHKIICWGKLGETCAQYLSKGRQVMIEGRLQYRTFEDKEKVTRKVAEIVARNVQFLGGPRKDEGEPTETSSDEAPEGTPEGTPEEATE